MSYKYVNYLWDDAKAASLDFVSLLVYRSNLLGSDQRITNTGGGNTSSKIVEKDPLSGEDVEVLWVKGSGGDLRTSKKENFSSLYQGKLIDLQKVYGSQPERGLKSQAEDDMVGMYPHTTFNLNPRPSSIDTPLHSFLPGKHVDHMHPNAIIAIAASRRCEELTKEIFGGEMAYVGWMRPGFELGLAMQEISRQQPGIKAIMMGQHGFISWDDDAKVCYTRTLDFIEKAAAYIESKYEAKGGHAGAFGGAKYQSLEEAQRQAVFAQILPWLRGQVSQQKRFVGTVQDDEKILRFVNSTTPRVSRSSAPPAPTISCVQRSSPSTSTGTRRPRTWPRSRRSSPPVWRPTAPTTRNITTAASTPTRPPCATRTRPWCSSPASAWLRGARTRAKAASPPSFTTAPSRSCAARRRSTNTSRSRSRRLLISSIGSWRRPSSSACPPRRNSPARSTSSSARAAASARKWPTGW